MNTCLYVYFDAIKMFIHVSRACHRYNQVQLSRHESLCNKVRFLLAV